MWVSNLSLPNKVNVRVMQQNDHLIEFLILAKIWHILQGLLCVVKTWTETQKTCSMTYFIFLSLKGHWTTSASSPIFVQKVKIFIPLEVYTYDCMLNLTCNFNLIKRYVIFFLAAAIFKSLPLKMATKGRLLKMATTVMTVEFATIHHYSSLRKILKLVCAVLWTDTKMN